LFYLPGDCDESLNEDRFKDFRPKSSVKLNFPKSTSKTYPLLRTLNDAIVLSLDEKTQEENVVKDRENEVDSNEVAKPQPNEPASGTPVAPLSTLTALALAVLALVQRSL
jgi:hypothetical protein